MARIAVGAAKPLKINRLEFDLRKPLIINLLAGLRRGTLRIVRESLEFG